MSSNFYNIDLIWILHFILICLPYWCSWKLSSSPFWVGHSWWKSRRRYGWRSTKPTRCCRWPTGRWASSGVDIFRHLDQIGGTTVSWVNLPNWSATSRTLCHLMSSYPLISSVCCRSIYTTFTWRTICWWSFWRNSLPIRICHFVFSLYNNGWFKLQVCYIYGLICVRKRTIFFIF